MLDGLRMNAVEAAANGVVDADTIFRFHQVGHSGVISSGHSHCEVESSGGVVRLIEYFQCSSKEGGGTSVIQQIA